MIKYYTVKETAEIFRRSAQTVYRWIEEGFLESKRVRDGHLISEIEVNRILNAKPEIDLPK